MALAGSAVGSALTKLKATLEGDVQAEVASEKIENDLRHAHQHEGKELTHHYKATLTHTLEVDDSVNMEELASDDKKVEKTKKKRSGCFGWCFGRKG